MRFKGPLLLQRSAFLESRSKHKQKETIEPFMAAIGRREISYFSKIVANIIIYLNYFLNILKSCCIRRR